jgi:hypothetical protein
VLNPSGTPSLQNVSDRYVTDHTFGCVRKTAGGYAVSKAFPPEKSLLQPGHAILSSHSGGTNDFMTPFKICRDLGSVLAVVKAELAGGDVWEVK